MSVKNASLNNLEWNCFILMCVFLGLCSGRNRQSGDQNKISDKDSKNSGIGNNNDRNAGESGRGRGSKEDRWNDRKPGGRGLYTLLMNIFQ